MVAAVQQGVSQRSVARRFGVSLRTVQDWVQRARGQRLDRVDWSDHRQRPRRAPNRTPPALEDTVLGLRRRLRLSILGEAGAEAIHAALAAMGAPAPSVRTIGRILVRHGQIDGHHRERHPPPPPGWYLPAVQARRVELELFDFIEMLKLQGGPLLDVLTGIGLHSGLPTAWPLPGATTTGVLACLTAHWEVYGCPGYAQFDNDTRFQGAHQHPHVFGRVVRLCLQLGITPVFAPPREFGLQNPIEHFNGLWQAKVWRRFQFAELAALLVTNAHYLAARHQRNAARAAEAPPRHPWPHAWIWRPQSLVAGTVVYIRRTTDQGRIAVLGQSWGIDRHWCHRLVRAEVDLRAGAIRCYALRRRAPADQPLLCELPYDYPRDDLVH